MDGLHKIKHCNALLQIPVRLPPYFYATENYTPRLHHTDSPPWDLWLKLKAHSQCTLTHRPLIHAHPTATMSDAGCSWAAANPESGAGELRSVHSVHPRVGGHDAVYLG